jgi:hypothetical protein
MLATDSLPTKITNNSRGNIISFNKDSTAKRVLKMSSKVSKIGAVKVQFCCCFGLSIILGSNKR